MRETLTLSTAVLAALLASCPLRGQQTPASTTPRCPHLAKANPTSTPATSFSLPRLNSFKILYEVTATTPGATHFFNPIRKGSVASDESVFDAATHAALDFEIVSGSDARKDPLMDDADPAGSYIKITLARPVPTEGQGRLVILKTYQDAKSYFRDADAIVFNRPWASNATRSCFPPGTNWSPATCPRKCSPSPTGASP